MRRKPDEATVHEFSEFVIGSQIRLIKFAELLTRDLGHAEDLVQHAYAKVFASWPRLRTGHPEAYARRCVVNAHRDWWRRGGGRELPVAESGDRMGGDRLAEENAERDAVLRALGLLTKRERAVIALKYYYDLPTDQIARELGIAEATVRTTVFRSLAKLREDRRLAPERRKS